MLKMLERATHSDCECAICVLSRGLESSSKAVSTLVEHSTDLELSLAYLRGQIEFATKLQSPVAMRETLLEALDAVKPVPKQSVSPLGD